MSAHPYVWALVWTAIGLSVVGFLWAIGHKSIIDRDERPAGIDVHSLGHIAGSAFVAALIAYNSGWLLGAICSAVVWGAVEVAQKNPHDRQGGIAEWTDVACNIVGAALGAALGAWLGASVRS